ncbi:DUF4192 domain-containing protein [Mycolicibacterium wolinskyi]|uniref:DUF4192 domain-containing protein n=1 Tax=Mycolicibacterium wolinskyi TaxID=59750 RepID=A0A1X2FJC0_9MYCO|nr:MULTISPECIES: DUF4192 domain-containing protein [Mycolicibacterium]MCV7286146.1 DUF4192 domain-containing protein [Mycolicibacterium wolinskyi]MCV7296342.1 DUF4192 domain-containing protein [Mycolicibacterium goodii]ORX18560.1 hypothetical protein AWC31_14800 [Mycolicibacterium wolinskyi]
MLKLGGLGDLVCNVVAVLGFRPVDSLVLVVVGAGELKTVMRVDLGSAEQVGAAARLAELVGSQCADGVVAVIVSEDAVSDPARGDRLKGMVSGLAGSLQRFGIELLDCVIVDRVAAGGRWFCADDPAVAGVLDDPASSVLAAVAVAGGRRLFDSRADLEALVALDGAGAAAVAPLVGDAVPVGDVAVAVRVAVDAMRQMGSGEGPTDRVLAEVGTSLADVRVRDALFNVGEAQDRALAERLWTRLGQVLPAPFRAEALTLLAFSAYLRGDGPVAGIALEAALSSSPGHRMAVMLDVALQSGLPPEKLRGLIAGRRPAVSV